MYFRYQNSVDVFNDVHAENGAMKGMEVKKRVASKNRTYLILIPKRLVDKNRTLYGLPGKYIVQPNTAHL
jgi:hypothetical protein